MKVEDFDLEQIKRLYGGGDYKFKFKTAEGKFFKTVDFTIDPRFRGVMDDAQSPRNPDGQHQAALIEAVSKLASPTAGNELMFQMMQQQGQSTGQMFQLMLTMMMKSQESVAKAQENMVLALAKISESRGQGPDLATAFMPLLIKLIERKESRSSISEILEAAHAIREFASNEQGGVGEGTLEKVLSAVAPALATLAVGASAAQVPVPQLAPAIETHPPGPSRNESGATLPQSEPATAPVNSSQSAVLTAYVPFLVNGARNGSDPESYHDLVLDVTNETELAQIIGILKTDNWCEMLFGNHPDVLAHKKWFEELRQLLIAPPESSLDIPSTSLPLNQGKQ
ncbi:MAG: hypothetical protein L0Z50_24830 [Verrucomicrobiales bacterium]|nr:hypothetical protein [Verrucomicrobiales bacterium]